MNPAWSIVLGWVVLAGFVSFILMGVDKARAIDRAWRIPERTFYTLALIGGAFGILLASGVFRHKTMKGSFMGVTVLITIVWLAVLLGFERLAGPPFG